jgi:DNA polymerase III subunit gamma/tau
MTFYLKYRPKNLEELDLLDVGESLKKILLSKSIPHAFLFSGPKGTGKTSAARIVAKVINCDNLGKDGVPCGRCEQCISISQGNNLDVVEMDAASHRGIDDVRTLREAVKLAPALSKKKIYIIDEAHMLTSEASNALLKTLEEPPEHVIFILATTNPEKLIDTIRSRTTLIPFRKATPQEISRSLKRVIDGEKIEIDDLSIQKIANAAGGAFRDAIKILEQFSLEGEQYLARYKSSDLESFIDSLIKKDEKAAVEEIEKNIRNGLSVELFLQELLGVFHKALLSEVGIGNYPIKGLSKRDTIILIDLFTEALKQLADSPIEQLSSEIAVVKWCSEKENTEYGISNIEENKDEKENISKPDSKKVEAAPAGEAEKNLSEQSMNIGVVKAELNEDQSDKVISAGVNDDVWKNILLAVRPINASIEGLLRSSRPVSYDGKTLTLGVFYKFHKERLEDSNHRRVLEGVLEKVLNSPTRIICSLVDPPPKKILEEAKATPVLTETKDQDMVQIAEKIFGN